MAATCVFVFCPRGESFTKLSVSFYSFQVQIERAFLILPHPLPVFDLFEMRKKSKCYGSDWIGIRLSLRLIFSQRAAAEGKLTPILLQNKKGMISYRRGTIGLLNRVSLPPEHCSLLGSEGCVSQCDRQSVRKPHVL